MGVRRSICERASLFDVRGKSDLGFSNAEGTKKWGVAASFTYNITEKQLSLQAASAPPRHETPFAGFLRPTNSFLRGYDQ